MKWFKDSCDDYVNVSHVKRIYIYCKSPSEWVIYASLGDDRDIQIGFFTSKAEAQLKLDEMIKCIS